MPRKIHPANRTKRPIVGQDIRLAQDTECPIHAEPLHVSANRCIIGTDGTFTLTGGELHIGTFIGDLINSGGKLCPGSSPHFLIVDGDYTQELSAVLQIELGGLTGGNQYDALGVTGTLTLGGSLEVVLVDFGGGTPQLADGDWFDILDWGALTGEFDVLNMPPLGPGLGWDTSALYTTGTISVVPEPATLSLLALGALAMLRRKRS